MEGGMPSMVQNLGESDSQPGEGRSESNERQLLLEKLEKSEAGRKKLRQAIALLKERLDATSQALEVNEALRQEVEKERLNVETERKRAEAEKTLRAKVEEDNVSIKEQLIGVLQRLDSLESSCKADRSECNRVRSEVKEGIGAALQAVEATQGLYQSTERSLHAKINGAVQSSSKALALAQSGQAATSRAQSAALAAQSLAKGLQKEVQVVSSQVATLQKQAFNLGALEALEPQLKGPGTPLNSPDAGESNVSLAVPKEKVSIDAAASPNSGTVLSKTQTGAQKSSQVKEGGDVLSMMVASTDKSRSNPMCSSSNGLPPRGGMFLSRNQIPDGGLKSTIPPVHLGVKSPKKCSVMVSRDELTSSVPLSQPGNSTVRKGPVAIIKGVDSILSPAVRVSESGTKSSPSLYITSPSARANSLQNQGEAQPQNFGDASGSREFSNKRPVVKRGRGDPNVAPRPEVKGDQLSNRSAGIDGKQITAIAGPPTRNVACNTVDDDDTFSEGMLQSNTEPHPSTATKLLKSVIKMFEKEGRNRKSMEDKLMKLQGALGSQCDLGQVAKVGTKRKRETRKEKGDGASEEKRKKRNRQGKESKKIVANLSLDDAVTSPAGPSEDKFLLPEKEVQQNDMQAPGDGEPTQDDRLSKMISTLQERCRDEGFFETTVDGQVHRDVPGAEECKDASSDVDICNDDVSKDGTGTNTDLESTDDDLGEDWWAKKVLLSPISSSDLNS